MATIKEWEEFLTKAKEICSKYPEKVRCIIKYRNKENMAVIKVVAKSEVNPLFF